MFNVMHWLVVSRSALLTELMDSRWPQEFLVRLSCLSPDRWHTDALGTDVDMLLLDLATVEPALGYKILKQVTRNRGCKVVLLHYPRRWSMNVCCCRLWSRRFSIPRRPWHSWAVAWILCRRAAAIFLLSCNPGWPRESLVAMY